MGYNTQNINAFYPQNIYAEEQNEENIYRALENYSYEKIAQFDQNEGREVLLIK